MAGDKLASGAKSATFGPPKVSQDKWDAIFGKKEKKGEEKVQDQPKKQAGARRK